MITIIVPIHKLDEETHKLFLTKAVPSIKEVLSDEVGLMIVGTEEVKQTLNLDIPHTFLLNSGDTSYQSQINLAVGNISAAYFYILEMDDMIPNKKYFKVVKDYIFENPSFSLFMPIVVDTEVINDKESFIQFGNTTTLLNFFYGKKEVEGNKKLYKKFSTIDFSILENVQSYSLVGCVINKEAFINAGGLKTKIDISFNYEFFLRFTNLGYNIMIIPKVGYLHLNGRNGSLFDTYNKNKSSDEIVRWAEIAKKEYHFKEDRDIE